MKNTGVVGVIAVVLLLSGCASAGPAAETAAAPKPSSSVETAEQTPEPLSASPAEAVEAPSESDAQYLSEVRLRLKTLPDATDEQLITAAETSCGLYGQGQDKFTQRLIEGEQPDASGVYADSTVIATWAATVYCPEFS